MRVLPPGLFAALILALPSVSAACSVCTAGRDEENAFAFLLSTIFMSVLPLLVIGGLVFFLWRRVQKLEAEQDALRAPVGASSSPKVSEV